MRIALIGLGEVGRVLAEHLTSHDPSITLTAWDTAFAEPGSRAAFNVKDLPVRAASSAAEAVSGADLVLVVAIAPEVGPVAIVDQRKDAAADRHPRLALVPGLFPRFSKSLDLLALLNVQRLAGLVILERRALKIHAQLRGPFGRCVRARTPPDAFAQSRGIRLEA